MLSFTGDPVFLRNWTTSVRMSCIVSAFVSSAVVLLHELASLYCEKLLLPFHP